MPTKNFKPRIVFAKPGGKSFTTSTANTDLSQRETLEAIILNLAHLLEIQDVFKQTNARGSDFYCANERGIYQSATNTILDMSKRLCEG
jgi:hypothetical protein